MAKIELFLIRDDDEIETSTAIEGDKEDLKELYEDLKAQLEEGSEEDVTEGTYESPPEGEEQPA